MRIFKNKAFAKFARKEQISDAKLWEAVTAAENGTYQEVKGHDKKSQDI